MAQIKTQANDGDVEAFLAAVDSDRRREDAQRICGIMAELAGADPVMWGPGIVGFGETEYTNTTGTHKWFRVGFSPRKASLTVYLTEGFDQDLLGRLGPHTTAKSCLYIKDLRAVDESVLRELITTSLESS